MEDISGFFWGLVFLVYSSCFVCIYYLTSNPIIQPSDPSSEVIPMNVSVSRKRGRRLAKNEAMIIRKDGLKIAKDSPFPKVDVDSKRILKAIRRAQAEMEGEMNHESGSEKENQDLIDWEIDENDDYVVVPKGLMDEKVPRSVFELVGKE